MKKGVQIVLVPGTRIPRWLRLQDAFVTVTAWKINDQRFRVVKIRGGTASFTPSAGVEICTPAMSTNKGIIGFPADQVVDIRDDDGNVIKRNRELCPHCLTLTGKNIGPALYSKAAPDRYQCQTCECIYTP